MMNACKPLLISLLLAILAGCASTQPYQDQRSVTSIAYSPDRSLLAYANASVIQVMEVTTSRRIRTLSNLPTYVEAADPYSFRHGVGDSMVFVDDSRIASTGMGGLITIWDIHSGRRLAKIDPLPDDEFASTLDYSPAANRLAVGTNTGQVFLTTIDSTGVLTPLVPMTKLESYVWDLQFGREGRYLAAAALMTNKQSIIQPEGEQADAFARAYTEDTSSDVGADQGDDATDSATDMSNVSIWDVEQMQKAGVLKGARGVFRMSLVPGEQALLTAGEEVQVWEFLTQKQLEDISDPNMTMQAIGMGTMAVLSLATLAGGFISPMDVLGNTFLAAGFPFIPGGLFIRHACARVAAISPDGNTIVSTTWGPTLNVMAVIDRKENKVVDKWSADGSVCSLKFSPDGDHLLAASSNGIFTFDTDTWSKQNLEKLQLKDRQ